MMRKNQKDIGSSMPFYAAPPRHKTSAEIISEARAHIHRGQEADSSLGGMSVLSGMSGAPRPLGTQRPFTPRDRQRTLFGKAGKASRPPSAVSLRYLQLQSKDSLMTSLPGTKRVQLSPMTTTFSSSLDERVFKHLLLDNIDEKPELTGARKKRNDASRRTKSLQSDMELEGESPPGTGSKLKLPSLNGLAKPLHQRKIQSGVRSSFTLNSLSEEKEDPCPNNVEMFSPLTSSKSSDSMIKTPTNSAVAKEKPSSADRLPFIPQTFSLEVFNKRRLFGDCKSKSEDVNRQSSMNEMSEESDDKMNINDYAIDMAVENNTDLDKENKNGKLIVEEKDSGKINAKKIDVQIPSPELNFELKTSGMTEFIPMAGSIADFMDTDRPKEYKIILNSLSDDSLKPLPDEQIISQLKLLYELLEKECRWQEINGDEKAIVLKTLYSFVESSNEIVLISIARIILSLRVTGSNLSGVCKLIFKVARNDKNDHLFTDDNTLELFMVGLGRAEPLHDAECLIYGYGALKFLGMSPTLMERMRPMGALPLMTLHLQMFNEARLEDAHSVGEQGCHALYQLTGALRNMAGGDHITKSVGDDYTNGGGEYSAAPDTSMTDFVASGAMRELCRTIELFADDLDVETNVSRTLSVLSADYECCVALCNQKGLLPAIIRLLEHYMERAPLIVRLTYILGNMVACNDDTRFELYEEPGAVDAILNILDTYLKRCWPGGEVDTAENIIIGSDLDGSSGSDEDVMVKAVRVIANMCMNSVVGARMSEVGGNGTRSLSWLACCLRRHTPPDGAELAASALAALNNLTYYHSGETPTAFGGLQIDLCEALCRLLPLNSGPCVTEAARVLGNMSRAKITRDYIVDTGCLMDITRLLENDDEEISLAAAGVLVNMAGDESARSVWLTSGGVQAATRSLHSAATRHSWLRAQLLCQALWNATPLPASGASLLAPLLLNILDEQQIFGSTDAFIDGAKTNGSSSEPVLSEEDLVASHLAWEEFAVVAVNLLEKIDPTLDSPCDEENEDFVFRNRAQSDA